MFRFFHPLVVTGALVALLSLGACCSSHAQGYREPGPSEQLETLRLAVSDLIEG